MKDTSRLPTIESGTALQTVRDWNKRVVHIGYKRGKHALFQPYCAGKLSQNTDNKTSVRAYSRTHLASTSQMEPAWPVEIAISCPDCLSIYQDHMEKYDI